jgi:hypothetical protein
MAITFPTIRIEGYLAFDDRTPDCMAITTPIII